MFSKIQVGDNVKIKPMLVKTLYDLEECRALVIPGGESTTIALLARLAVMSDALRKISDRIIRISALR